MKSYISSHVIKVVFLVTALLMFSLAFAEKPKINNETNKSLNGYVEI